MSSKSKKGFARSFIENFSLVMILDVLAMTVTFLGVAVLVRLMGVHELGLLLYARLLSTNGVWQLFDPGIRMRMSRAISVASTKDNDETVRMIFIAGIQAMSAISVVATTIFILAQNPLLSVMLDDSASLERFAPVYIVAVLLWLVEFPAIALVGLMEGLRRFEIVKFIDLGQGIIANLLMIALALQGYGFEILAYAYLGLALVRFVILLWIAFWHLRINPASMLIIETKAFRSLFSKSQHFFAFTSLGQIYAQIEKLAFVVFLPPSFIVALEIVNKLPRAIRTVTDNTRPVVINFASSLHSSKSEDMTGHFMKITGQINIILCAGFSMFCVLEAPAIINIWVGPEFAYLVPYIWINLAYNILLPPFGMLRDYLISQDRGLDLLFRYFVFQTIIRSIVLVLVFLYEVPLAFGLGLLLGLVVTPFLFRQSEKVLSLEFEKTRQALIRPYVAIVVVSIFYFAYLLFFPLSETLRLALGIVAFGCIFLIGLYYTGTIKDLMLLKKIR
jgi:O-antigen/teichoic acid export membrane protein